MLEYIMSHSLVVDTKNVRSLVKIVERDLSKQPAQQGNRKMRLTRQGAEEFKRKFAELKPNVQEEISLMVKLADKLLWADLQQLTDGQSNFKPIPASASASTSTSTSTSTRKRSKSSSSSHSSNPYIVLATFRAEKGNSYMMCNDPKTGKSRVLQSPSFSNHSQCENMLNTLIKGDMPDIKHGEKDKEDVDMSCVEKFNFERGNKTYYCYVVTVNNIQKLTARKLTKTPFTMCNWLTPEQLRTTDLKLNTNTRYFVRNMPTKATPAYPSKSTRGRKSATTRGRAGPKSSSTRGRAGPKSSSTRGRRRSKSSTRGRRSANAGAGEGRDFSGLRGGGPTGLPYSWFNASGGGAGGAPFHMSHFGGPLAKPYFPNC